jgi:hypothetical protein
MDKDLKNKLENAVKAVSIPDTIKYICVCKAGYLGAKRERTRPLFLQSRSALNVNVWLMPEFVAGFSRRKELDIACEAIGEILGEGYTVGVCPMKNDMLMHEGFYINVN